MLNMLKRLFLQPKAKAKAMKKEKYHFILIYENENGHSCTFRTYSANYQGAKTELLRQYPDKKITNIFLKSKNLQCTNS